MIEVIVKLFETAVKVLFFILAIGVIAIALYLFSERLFGGAIISILGGIFGSVLLLGLSAVIIALYSSVEKLRIHVEGLGVQLATVEAAAKMALVKDVTKRLVEEQGYSVVLKNNVYIVSRNGIDVFAGKFNEFLQFSDHGT